MSEIVVRPVELVDKAGLREFCQNRKHPDSAFISAEEMKRHSLRTLDQSFEALAELEELDCWVALKDQRPIGYLIAQSGQTESITGESQTVVLEAAAANKAAFDRLLEVAVARAREAEDDYIVIYTYQTQKVEQLWVHAFGFKQELLRHYLEARPGQNFDHHPDYQLRPAAEHELLFILRVVADHSPAYIPGNRPVDELEIRKGFVNSYTDLSVRDRKKVPCVLAARSGEELVGYIILKPGRMLGDTGPLGLYVYDIAIGSQGHGKGLSRYLVSGTQELLKKMGGGFIYGDVSATNSLAVSAQRALGFQLDSIRWGMAL